MVGYGLDYACAHIIILASINLLPIQADFVTERVNLSQLQYTLGVIANWNVFFDFESIRCAIRVCLPL